MRRLAPEEDAAWGRVMATVRPLKAVAKPSAPPVPPRGSAVPSLSGLEKVRLPVAAPVRTRPGAAAAKAPQVPARPRPADTLDASWDRRLARGAVSPDGSLDLHGHTLASAHAMLDAGLDRALRRGDRVLLLVTGKPPRPESERPHARGAIRAAVADWIAMSRFADRIAAVRGAHPRHGGQGALYIVLRRPRGG